MSELTKEMPKKLGFGCMRLPVTDGSTENINDAAFCEMIDSYLEQGFKYFDTAYPYHNGRSEEAVGRCLVQRYARDRFFLASKMPVWLVKEYTDYGKYFEEQLKKCQVEYFDFYLLHAMNKDRVKEAENLGGFQFVQNMKEKGKIRHIGFSFHDKADVLDEILTNHPEMEFVQLQINYYDWESENVQSRKCYEVAEKHGVPVIVMEPVKGGTLANMVGEPARILSALDENASYASYAIRYAASLPNVILVLRGMSDLKQLQDNTAYMKDFQPLTDKEQQAIGKVVEELEKLPTIPCTNCRYCVEGCPKQIRIPDIFGVYNMGVQFGVTDAARGSYRWQIDGSGKAGDCIKCGKCEAQCPQHLEIRKLLEEAADIYEKEMHL